jgi:DNA replication protein DnaC
MEHTGNRPINIQARLQEKNNTTSALEALTQQRVPIPLTRRHVLPDKEGKLVVDQCIPSTLCFPSPTEDPVSSGQCPLCKGVGFLRVDVPYGHPQFGKPIACICKQAEWAEKRKQQLAAMSNLEAFRDKDFTSFNWRVPGVQEAFREALSFAQCYKGWLLLIGPNGCGKTHLAAAIANHCLSLEKEILFITTPDLLDHLRATFAPTSPVAYDKLFWHVRKAEILVIDDLGSEQSSSWAEEKLFQLFNHRYNWRLPTVITANANGLKAVDVRISSRLSDTGLVHTVVMDEAEDYRPYKPAHKVVDSVQSTYLPNGRKEGGAQPTEHKAKQNRSDIHKSMKP